MALNDLVQSIGTFVLPILLVAVPFVLQQKKRRLNYQVLFNRPLVRVESGYESRLDINFDGKPAKSLSWVALRIINAGNVPIEASHFAKPIVITTPQGASMLDVTIKGAGDVEASWAKYELEDGRDAVEIAPLLLNEGDSIGIDFLVAGEADVSVSARVSGVKEVKRYEFSDVVRAHRRYSGALAIGIGITGGILFSDLARFFIVGQAPGNLPVQVLSFLAGLFVVGFSVAVWLYGRRLTSDL